MANNLIHRFRVVLYFSEIEMTQLKEESKCGINKGKLALYIRRKLKLRNT